MIAHWFLKKIFWSFGPLIEGLKCYRLLTVLMVHICISDIMENY
jgi:hypothetical protein